MRAMKRDIEDLKVSSNALEKSEALHHTPSSAPAVATAPAAVAKISRRVSNTYEAAPACAARISSLLLGEAATAVQRPVEVASRMTDMYGPPPGETRVAATPAAKASRGQRDSKTTESPGAPASVIKGLTTLVTRPMENVMNSS